MAIELCSAMVPAPGYPPVSIKIHGQPWRSITHFHNSGITNDHGNGSHVQNWRSQGQPGSRGRTSSAPTSASPTNNGGLLKTLRFRFLLDIFNFSTAITVTAPIRRVQFLMQSQNMLIKSGRLSQPYRGIFDCFARTVRNEGFFSLWRGNGAPVINYAANQAIGFAVIYSQLHESSASHYKKEKDASKAGIVAAVANLAVLTHLPLLYPLQYVETRMTNDIKTSGRRQFNGMFDVVRKTLKYDGIVGIYRGFLTYVIKGFMGGAIKRNVFATLRPLMRGSQSFYTQRIFGRGGIPSLCALLAVYPLQTVSRRMMMTSGEAVKYKGALDAFWQILKNENIKSFYYGAGTYILHFALNAVLLVTFELLQTPREKRDGSGDKGQPRNFPLKLKWKWLSGGDGSGSGSGQYNPMIKGCT